MEQLTYAEAKDRIEDGDILIFQLGESPTLLQRLIAFFSRDTEFHAAIALWMTEPDGARAPYCIQAGYTLREMVPLLKESHNRIDVWKCPVPVEPMIRPLIDGVGKVWYGYKDFLALGIKYTFKLKVCEDFPGEICSEMVAKLLVAGGMDLRRTVISPSVLATELENHGAVLKFRIN
jgi:hypothetical protein